jgi:NAD(P)-dependent dehydrogenase (short-subunit alcohol dehydrogenase family)
MSQVKTARRLDGRIALITAAGSGMGRAGALRFAEEGANVIATDLRLEAVEETAELGAGAAGVITPKPLDVTDLAALRATIEEIGRKHGVLHVLYNHAGSPGPAGLDVTEEEWDRTVDVNAKSAFFATSYARELLGRAEGKASVLFTSSASGLVASPGSPVYNAVKGGIVVMMKGLAVALAPEGIRCNAICPGAVRTPMLSKFLDRADAGLSEEEMEGFVTATHPMGRSATPEEIANVALFLACDESSFVTGVALPVDGGYTAR